MMYLSRAVPRQNVWDNPDIFSLFQSSYSIHQSVWGFFHSDPDKKRNFLYRYDINNGKPVIYIVSEEKPINVRGVWVVETKEYTPQISEDSMLGFSVRINPIVTRWMTDEKTGKQVQKRHDVVMDYKMTCHEIGLSFSYEEAMYKTGVEWLMSRSQKHGFTIIEPSIRVDQYQRHEFSKKIDASENNTVVIATMDLQGILRVTDATKFVNMLYSGLGPAKGFGCGMMLVRKIRG